MSSGKREAKRRKRRQRERRSDRRPSVSNRDSDKDQSAEGSPSESDDEKESQSDSDEEVQISRVLIRKGASLDDFAKLNNAISIESKIARSRGRAEFIGEDGSEEDDSDEGLVHLCFQEGKLELETDYVMHFVQESHTELPIYDIIGIPDAPCYPVSQTTLESLPRWAQAKLERQGHLKCSGVYDRPTKKFFSIHLGWDDYPQNTADVLAEILQEYDGERLARSVYYFLHEYASDDYSDPETIAELRDIQESSVKSEIEKAREQLDLE
jgi:hypothetical protein